MIEGIGGAFLFSNDVKALAAWYRDNLGLDSAGEESVHKIYEVRDFEDPEKEISMAWAILPADEDIRGQPRTGKINYRVKNLDEILAHLKSRDVPIEKSETHPYGKFATVRDPEGNAIELWEPI